MKKIICLTLSAVLALGLVACGGAKKSSTYADGKLYTGFGRADITPKISTPLGGYDSNDQRMSGPVMDPLMATCIAFTEGKETFLLFSVDAVRSSQDWTDRVRQEITKELKVPAENVLIVSTHSHSAPNTTSHHASMMAYADIYVEGCVKAAKDAMKNRAETTMYSGSVMTENMTFVRHYEMNDGTVAGPNFGSWVSGIKGYMVPNDPEMILVKLERKGEKDILMMNFQAHTTLTGGADKLEISADYVGVVRNEIEAQTDMHFAYFLGACGNQTPNSNIATDNMKMPYADKLPSTNRDYNTYGLALAYYAIDLLPNLTELKGEGIETTSAVVTCNTNKIGIDRLLDAQLVVDEWAANGREAGNAMAARMGFNSVYECSGIVGSVDRPDTYDVEVYATRIGGLNFVNAPYEMFSTNALYIKENTPKGDGQVTMVMTQTNHAWGYITDKTAFTYPCYENFGGTFAEGSGEALAEKMVELLNQIQ